MTRPEFHALRDLPGKRITDDIIFRASASNGGNLTFENIPVENELGWDVIVNGTFKPDIPTVIYNFYVRSEGPICRICVNGNSHKPGGRTHKHELRQASDQRAGVNLPTVIARPELENLSPRKVWDILLKEANITHTGTFTDPT